MQKRVLVLMTVGASLLTTLSGPAKGAPLPYKGEQMISGGHTQTAAESPAAEEFRKGIAALLNSNSKAAEQAFQNAISIDPTLAGPLLGLADVAMSRNQPKEAEKWLAAASKAQPNSDAVMLGWGRYYRARNDHAKAEQAFKQAISTRPSATAYVELGDIYLSKMNKRQEALKAYGKAVALAPESAAMRYSYATGLAANGQVAQAVKEFEQVARLSPKDAEPWRAIGRLHAEQHRYAEAAAAMDQGLKLQPDYVPLLADRGDVAATQGKMNEVIRYYKEAARHAPGAASLQTKLGLAYQLSRRWSDAETAYLQAIKADPKAADAYNNLAWLALNQGKRLDDALKWADKAVQLTPGNPSYLDTLGWVYRKRGDLAKAAETLRKASSIQPPLADVHYHLGEVYAAQGKNADAISALRRALQISPTFPEAENARKRLEALGG